MPDVDPIPTYENFFGSDITSEIDTAFNTVLLIGKGEKGQPYSDVSCSPLKLLQRQDEVDDYYDKDSDIAIAFKYFKKHGGGLRAYCLNASNATKGTGWLLDGSSAQLIKLTAANWGSWSADIGIKVENNTTYVIITITDPADSGIKVVSDQLTSLTQVLQFLNVSGEDYFAAQQQTELSTLPATFDNTLAATYDYAAGTNPDPTVTDYENIIAFLPQWIQVNNIRWICPVADLSGADQHNIYQQFRDLAIAQRLAGYPIQIICGGIVGDIVIDAGDTTDPVYRTGIYNSQDVLFCAPGIDNLGAFISFAPAIVGWLNKSPICHNLTADEIFAWRLETIYSTADLETLIDAGVISIIKSKNSYNVSKGVNTLQDNDSIWNVVSGTTILPSQRAIADYVQKTFKEDLERFVGSDGVTSRQLLSRCNYLWDNLATTNPNIFGENLTNELPYRVDKIEQVGSEAWNIILTFIPAFQTNFIGLNVQICTNY